MHSKRSISWLAIPMAACLMTLSNTESTEGRFGFGIGAAVTCFGPCPPGQGCTKFAGTLFGVRQDYCKCAPLPPPPPPPVPGGGGGGGGNAVIDNGEFNLNGKFNTAEDFPADPILGSAIILSAPLVLVAAEQQPNGDNLARFAPNGGPVSMSVGNYLNGNVTSVLYVGDNSTGSLSVTVENLSAGTAQSDYVDALLAGPNLLGWGIGLDTPTDVFATIQNGGSISLNLTGPMMGVVPEPSAFVLLALGVVGLKQVAFLAFPDSKFG